MGSRPAIRVLAIKNRSGQFTVKVCADKTPTKHTLIDLFDLLRHNSSSNESTELTYSPNSTFPFLKSFKLDFTMPQGNGMKAKMRRERQAAKDQGSVAHSQLKTNEASKTILCKVCRQSFMGVASVSLLREHQEAKHAKLSYAECFDKTE